MTAALRAANGTNRGYVDVLYDALRAERPNLHLKNFGCGGETTASLIAGGAPFDYRCGYGTTSQLAEAVSFLEDNAGRIALVTIDIGANDVFGGSSLPEIAQNLSAILTAVRHAAGPVVPIVAMNYYDPFVAPVWFETQSVAAVQAEAAASAAFNNFLEGIYAAFGVPVADVEAAFQVQDVTLVNGTPVNVLRECQWTWICAAGDIHANDAGYRVIAGAFEAVIP